MIRRDANEVRPRRVPTWLVVGGLVCLSGVGGVVAKRLSSAPVPPALVAVDRPASHTTDTIGNDMSEPVEVVSATPEETYDEPTVVEIADPLQGRSVEPTRWTDDDGVTWERAPEGFDRYYDGRPLVKLRTIWMTTTAYSPDHRSCGKWADGKTASMKSVWTNGMELVAADRRVLEFGSLISIPGYADERVVPVLDVGGAIKGSRLDLLYPTHAIARTWGVQKLPVTVWGYADEVE